MDTTGDWIAVVAQWRRGFTRLPIHYVHAVELAGGNARVLSSSSLRDDEEDHLDAPLVTEIDPLDASHLEGAGGLLIPGGGDIDPEWYGAERHPRTTNVSNERDRFELTLLEAALGQDMPVLAICHGMQLLNVHLGGTLVQHLADNPQYLEHDRDRPRADAAHEVRVKKDSLLYDVFGPHAKVNSHHHQGLERVSDRLEEIAWAEDDVLEGVVMKDRTWVLGVQWHPEAMAPVDDKELRIFEIFVEAARAFARDRATSEARTA